MLLFRHLSTKSTLNTEQQSTSFCLIATMSGLDWYFVRPHPFHLTKSLETWKEKSAQWVHLCNYSTLKCFSFWIDLNIMVHYLITISGWWRAGPFISLQKEECIFWAKGKCSQKVDGCEADVVINDIQRWRLYFCSDPLKLLPTDYISD